MQRGEVFKRGDSWTARWYERRQRKQKGGFRTKAEAQLFLQDVLSKQRLGVLYAPGHTTGELVETFKGIYKPKVDPVTFANFEYSIKHFLDFLGDDRLLTSIGELDIEALAASMPLPHQRWKGIRSTKQVLSAGVRWKWILESPASGVPNPAPPAPRIRPFQSWSYIEMIEREIHERWRGVPTIATGTGLRPEEWLALHDSDIDLDAGVIHVSRVYTNGVLKPTPKTLGSERSVPIRTLVKGPLTARLEAMTGNIVFPNTNGSYQDLSKFRTRVWHPALAAAGVEKHRVYDMRHTYATFSIAAGVSLFALARRMGTSVEQIDRTYGHLLDSAAESERALLDEFDAPDDWLE